MREWNPAGTVRQSIGRPDVGDMVAYDRGAYIVSHVADAEPSEDEAKRLAHYRLGTQAQNGPYSMTIDLVHGQHDPQRMNEFKQRALRVPALAHYRWRVYLEGRVPLCSCCGHPWPCLMTDAAAISKEAAELMERRMVRAQPGCCYSCGEVITQRQESIRYPEGNVDLPGYPAPRFHTRNSCWDGRYSYEKRRAKAIPDVAPVLVIPGQTLPGVWGPDCESS